MKQTIYLLLISLIGVLSLLAGRFESQPTIHRTASAATAYWAIEGKKTVAASFIEFEIVNEKNYA